MRPTSFGAVLCAAALAFLVGCGGSVPNGTAADPKATGDSAIDAGLSFGDGAARDEMAIQIAKEASGIGNADAVRHALQKWLEVRWQTYQLLSDWPRLRVQACNTLIVSSSRNDAVSMTTAIAVAPA